MSGRERKGRIADQIKREIADILLRRVKDPRLQGITITVVRVSDDLKDATVFYCDTFPKTDRESVHAAFASASGFIRRELGKRLYLRYTPRISFMYDDSFDYAEKIDQIIETLRREEGG